MTKEYSVQENQNSNWFWFNVVYSKILNSESRELYLSFCLENMLNCPLKNNTPSFKNENKNMEKFRPCLQLLERVGLIEMDGDCVINVHQPMSLVEIFNNSELMAMAEMTLHPHYLNQLQHLHQTLIGNKQLSPASVIENDEKDIPINSYMAQNFYHSLYKSLSTEFSVPVEVWGLMNKYVCDTKKINITIFQKLSIIAIKEGEDGKYICPNNLLFLINAKLNPMTKIDAKEHLEFWKNIMFLSDVDIEQRCESLFNTETVHFYQTLLKKNNPPKKLKEWIAKSNKINHLDFSILNVCISFTKVWIKQVPVTYLDKITDQFHENGISTIEEVIYHFKMVINHDMENNNKLGIVEWNNGPEVQKLFN